MRLLLKVGGGDPTHGPVGGIHWHMNLGNKVEYIATDERRQVIPWVRFTGSNGVVTEYRTADFKEDPKQHKIRTMDCIDCHNRPAHHFRAPNDAVDLAIAAGRIDPRVAVGEIERRRCARCGPTRPKQQALQNIEQTLRVQSIAEQAAARPL